MFTLGHIFGAVLVLAAVAVVSGFTWWVALLIEDHRAASGDRPFRPGPAPRPVRAAAPQYAKAHPSADEPVTPVRVRFGAPLDCFPPLQAPPPRHVPALPQAAGAGGSTPDRLDVLIAVAKTRAERIEDTITDPRFPLILRAYLDTPYRDVDYRHQIVDRMWHNARPGGPLAIEAPK